MKFVSVRELRLNPAKVWKLARQEKELVVTANGRPVAILTGTDEESFEEELDVIRRARALRALESLQTESVTRGTHLLGLKEIDSEIQAVRKGRRLEQ
jgi:prevent-host-death family protein